jgi:hypothetical protein
MLAPRRVSGQLSRSPPRPTEVLEPNVSIELESIPSTRTLLVSFERGECLDGELRMTGEQLDLGRAEDERFRFHRFCGANRTRGIRQDRRRLVRSGPLLNPQENGADHEREYERCRATHTQS